MKQTCKKHGGLLEQVSLAGRPMNACTICHLETLEKLNQKRKEWQKKKRELKKEWKQEVKREEAAGNLWEEMQTIGNF